MNSISIRYYMGSAPAALYGTTLQLDVFEMTSVSDTSPGNALYSAQGTWPVFNTAHGNTYITFTFPSISISNGNVYGFMVSQITEVNASFQPAGRQTSDSYTGGRALAEIDGVTEILNAQYDMVFRVNGTAIPEPSTYAAITGLVVVSIALLRRRPQRDIAA